MRKKYLSGFLDLTIYFNIYALLGGFFMLTDDQKEKIREIKSYDIYFYEKKGIPINGSRKKIYVPNFLELRQKAFEEILKEGFSHIIFASPYEANCIVRVFKKEHCSFGLCIGQIHNLWGFNCFVQEEDGTWTSIAGKSPFLTKFEINFSEHKIIQWICQDEAVTYNCDFFDSYIIIK